MRLLPLLLLTAIAAAQGPEPGRIDPDAVPVEELAIAPVPGDAKAALAAFVEAHALHREGRAEDALAGYLRFLGMPGRGELPARYAATVQERVDAMLAAVRERHAKAVALYRADRAKGLEELRLLAERHPALPEGRAALALRHSDLLRAAVTEARALFGGGRVDEARSSLEKAVRAYTASVYRYEAKSCLVELGGPDLFERGERVGEGEDEGTEIEVSDG